MERGAARKVHHAVVRGAAGELGRISFRSALDQYPLGTADHGVADGGGLLVQLPLQPLQALALYLVGNLAGEVGGRGSGPRAVDEAKRPIAAGIGGKLERGGEVGLGLAREAD